MSIQKLIDRLGDKAGEVLDKAVQCHRVEELTEFAKEKQIALSQEEARQLFEAVHVTMGELGDGDLAGVTGGVGVVVVGGNVAEALTRRSRCRQPGCDGYMDGGVTAYDGGYVYHLPRCKKCGAF